MRRRLSVRARVAIAGALVVLGVWGVVVGIELFRVAAQAREGRNDVLSVVDRLDADRLAHGSDEATLADATVRLDRAADGLRTPELAPLRALPVVGRQIRSAQALSRLGARLSSEVATTESVAAQVTEQVRDDPAGRPAAVSRLADAVGSLRTTLEQGSLGPGDGLVGPLYRARSAVVRTRVEVGSRLDDVETSLRQAALVLTGPRRVLVLAADNGEMRDGAGAVLAAAEIDIANGTFTPGDFTRAGHVVAPPGSVTLDPDVAARFSFLTGTTTLQATYLSPRGPVSGAQAAAIWAASGRPPVDDVVTVDIPALADLVRVTGPVAVGATTISGGQVVGYLLHDQYAGGLPGLSPGSSPDRYLAQDQLAASVLHTIASGRVDPIALLDALAGDARGRHVIAWSAHADTQALWQRLGAAGVASPRSVSVGSVNLSGNKLDQYLGVTASVSTEPTSRPGATGIAVAVQLNDEADGRAPSYVLGPGIKGLQPGEYRGLLTVRVPAWARDVQVEGGIALGSLGPDGPDGQLVVVEYDLQAGTATTITVRFASDGAHGSLRLEPGARHPDLQWRFDGQPLPRDDGHTVTW